ncbi:MAG: response regulator [Prolixibacteraceae bacterium]|nr:response regulator [Prolixibacteraceae bacterium]
MKTAFANPVEIERFEHIDSKQGLSQNNVLSMYCDHLGFIWFGTMDGLNRYDGYNFEIIKSETGKKNVLTHNRISQIWEDKSDMLWVKTYDGYYHYYIRETGGFITFPDYQQSIEKKNSVISCFTEGVTGEIWMGTTNSGFYHLTFNSEDKRYNAKQFTASEPGSVSNNSISFIENGEKENVWIGTKNGLNLYNSETSTFQTFHTGYNFSCAATKNNQVYFGTLSGGLFRYNNSTALFEVLPGKLSKKNIRETGLLEISGNNLLIGTPNRGLLVYNFNTDSLLTFDRFGLNIRQIFIDSYGLLWIKTEHFGLVKIDLKEGKSKHFDLIEKEKQTIIDDERPYIYEDQQRNLWIGIHGGGLALYDRANDSLVFYRNDPLSDKTLSSDFVHCIAEDKSGLLWVGTGQFNGGANKVIYANPSFKQIKPCENITNLADNVIRCVFEDSNRNIWMASKSGSVYIYNPDLTLKKAFENFHLVKKDVPGYNVYCIMEDHEGYIWMGTKGGGVFVSKNTITKGSRFYSNLSFNQYTAIKGDSLSLTNNNVYSLLEDPFNNVWIGTYGGGISKVISRTANRLTCMQITTQNSNLSSNDVRYLFLDSRGLLWIATGFGLNVATPVQTASVPVFDSFFYDPASENSISYNDVIHIFEDSKRQLWFGTFGGGVSLLKKYNGPASSFIRLNVEKGLVNDAVFSILEDESGKIWMGTESGISSYLPARLLFENYDVNSGLFSENFCENSCCSLSSGNLMFGSISGALLIMPENIEKTLYAPPVVITNFQLNNRDVDITDPQSPINQRIETLDEIVLKHNQSSFSFEYAALSFFAPGQNRYSFILENFENEWNNVGIQRKSTYTNLSPGSYVFKVKAANWDGAWNEIPRQVKITITPPWWASIYAYIAYIVITIVLLDVARRIFLKYYRMQNDLKVERRVNDIKLQFFTNISHEIRTPLTLILGPIDDIKSIKKLPAEVKTHVDIMERNGKRMLKLLNQLLDFRKIQKKKMDLQIEAIDLSGFVNEIYEQFLPIAHHKQIDFKLIKPNKKITVFADPNKFDSVVFNILSNAFKYTPEKKKITVEIFNPANDYVDIDITDEGSGISKEKLSFLFQRFTPLSAGDNQLNGTGIGLSLAYEIMKLHKGDILVESEEGNGAKFKIRLLTGTTHFENAEIHTGHEGKYRHRSPDEEDEKLPENEPYCDGSEKQPLALVIEDNPEVLMYIANCLKEHFRVEKAIDGTEGLDKLTVMHPDIIITDVMMPKKDGIEFTLELKANFETSHIPVIMLTAKSNIADQVMGIEAGAEAYILKPFNSTYLRAVALNFIKQREAVIRKYRDKAVLDSYNAKISSRDDQFLKEIFSIIEEHLTDSSFNVEHLIDYSKYSRTVMYNKIKGLLGVTPVDLVRQLRLKHAAMLFTRKGHKISEAAYASGFNDPKYFRKCFKNFYGMSPTEYMKSGQWETAE